MVLSQAQLHAEESLRRFPIDQADQRIRLFGDVDSEKPEGPDAVERIEDWHRLPQRRSPP
jgi:hypothetical protein